MLAAAVMSGRIYKRVTNQLIEPVTIVFIGLIIAPLLSGSNSVDEK